MKFEKSSRSIQYHPETFLYHFALVVVLKSGGCPGDGR